MRFAAVMPQKTCLRGHLVLGAPHKVACFERVESISPRNHLHLFRLESEDQFTKEFGAWVQEAYKVGCQEHLKGEQPNAQLQRTGGAR
jgi:hypothetical protein